MIRLSDAQLSEMKASFHSYFDATNAASGSKLDPNANVTQKTISTAESEVHKGINVQLNRSLIADRIAEIGGVPLAKRYHEDIENHFIYVHDETSLKPYCTSITMYPFLLNGMTEMGGESQAPKHLESFCGSFINLVLATSNQFAGAVATVEFLTYLDYFARKDLGQEYAYKLSMEDSKDANEVRGIMANHLQHVVYALNQPVTRGDQAVFWNISLFDRKYFESMFADFIFPDGSRPVWDSVRILQDYFQEWFNAERNKATLTFPVVTAAMLTEGGSPSDKQFARRRAQDMEAGNSFFIYMSESADSLASCCRLRNEIASNEFSYSLGAGGVMTGSINVISLNLNRILQEGARKGLHAKDAVKAVLDRVYVYQRAYRAHMDYLYEQGALSAYNAGLIDLDKQFLTIGINGLLEASEFFGLTPGNNEAYRIFNDEILKVIYESNREAEKLYGLKFNTEFVPAENLGVKNAKWDREDGYAVSRDCYNSYFYRVEDTEISVLDKFALYDKEMVRYLDGGSALHLNLGEHPDADQWLKLFDLAATRGVQYWTYNVPGTRCKTCNTRSKQFLAECPACDSDEVVHSTRIIGYLKEVENFSEARQKEHSVRHYHAG